jgi:putative SOS response-associated peptidase YedK
MCGRFVSASTPEAIAEYFGAQPPAVELGASYNVAPTNDVYAVVMTPDGTKRVEAFRWGLVPVWAKDVKVGQKMINARAETLLTKPAYKGVVRKHRCIVPMDGFYEWKTPSGPDAPVGKSGKPLKQPMYIHRLDGEPLGVAGLWSSWRPKDAEPDTPWLHSLTIVTVAANETMQPVHDRMPAILGPAAWDRWLQPGEVDVAEVHGLLVPAPEGLLTMHPVSTDVNRVGEKGPGLIDPVDPPAPAAE